MRIKRGWQAALFAATAVTMLALASGGAASSAATISVTTAAQLNAALLAAGSGDTILIKPGTYFTADATTPADGYTNANGGVTITGKTDSKGNCTKTSTTILDGDNKPTVGPGHVGPVFTVGGNNTKFKCLTFRFGTAGIVSDGFDGLNVKSMAFVGNGRDLNQNTDNWDGDGIWVQDGNGVTIKKSTFSGMGRSGVESDLNLNTSNDAWVVQSNVLKNIHESCLDLSNNTTTQVGQLSGSKASNGNTCTVIGNAASLDAIVVDDGGVGGTPNVVAGNTVTSAWYRCFSVTGDGAKFFTNTCTASHDYEGVHLDGDGIVLNGFTVGQSYNPCITSDGDNQVLKNIDCGSTRSNGVVINGDGTKVTNLEIRQSLDTCLAANGDNQVWTTVSCAHVTDTGGGQYGLDAEGMGSSFTGITIGDVYDTCFYFNNTGLTIKTISCHGSSNGNGIVVNDNDLTVDGFDITSSQNGCAITNDVNTTFKNGHCGRVLGDEAVYGSSDGLKIDKVVVDAAYGDCFAMYSGVGGSVTNSTGRSCGTGDINDGGIEWDATGTNTISGNNIKQSSDNSLLVNTTGGDYTINNNTFKNAQNDDCVNVSNPDTLTMTGNKVQGCGGANILVDVDTNPKVNSNTATNGSGTPGTVGAMLVTCDSTCDGGQVNSNTIDASGNSGQGLLVTNNSGGTGLTISGNTITNTSGHGLEVDGDGANTLTNNTVTNAGGADEFYGIFLNSDDNALSGSKVSGGFDNGIEVVGDNNTVNSNLTVSGNGEDGIHVNASADSTIVSSNTTLNNAGEGIENDGTLTTLTNNTSTGNRQDCAGTGTTVVVTGNVCTDGTTFTDPGSIDKPVKK